MKPVKYTILLLAALVVFSSAVEAEKTVTISRVTYKSTSQLRREQKEREKRLREKREKEAKAREKYNEQKAAYYKKKKAAAAAAEKERSDKAKTARLEKDKKDAAAKKTAREEKALLGKYDAMATEVKMPSAQRAKLVALLRKLKGGSKAPKSRDNQAEIARLTKAYNEATGEKKGIIASALEAARKKSAGGDARGSRADHHRQVMALLTPAQKLKWGGFNLAKDPALKFEGVTLTEKQIKRIRAICDAAAKDLPDEAADIDPKTAAKARKAVLRTVRLQIVFEVLTPEQRTAIQRDDAKKRAAAAAADK